MYFDKLLLKSTNRPSTTWNMVKTITNNVTTSSNIAEMNVNNNLTSNSSTIANAFNAYFFFSSRESYIYKLPRYGFYDYQ